MARTTQQPMPLPRCAECGGTKTEPVTTMRRHTCHADEWYRCDECEHVFSVSRMGES
jgi:uncharacterized protein with PIN domain